MCVYDITVLNEDEAITSVLNTESSVVRFSLYPGPYGLVTRLIMLP